MKAEAIQALEQGDIAAALRLWSRITAGDAPAADLLEHAILLQRLYRSEEAAELWERLLAHPDASSTQLLAAGKQGFERRCFAGCARFTARALAMSPDSPDTAALHAAALERAGDLPQAEQVIHALLGKHPRHARLIRLQAHLARRDGRLEEASRLLEGALRATSTDDDWRLRYELAGVLDLLGDFAGAIRELQLAKRQLEPSAANFRPAWRAMTERQWQLTCELTADRLQRWGEGNAGTRGICLMGGFPRSGTTLLEQVICTHPDVIGTDEAEVLATQFRDPMVFGAESAKAALAELDGFDVAALAAGRDEYFRCITDVLGEDPGTRLLIEKDPLHTADLAVPLRLFPQAKVLMPLRDPRDVVISYFFTIVPASANSVASATLGECCQYYAQVMRHWLLLRDRLEPARWMESRYEELLAEPAAQTRKLAAFLGLDWRPEMLAHHRHAGSRAIGTPTYDNVAKPLYTRSLGRWRRYEQWLAPHLHHLQPYLDAFGYR